jgi:Spy/CpxP family protein refolding chaperone
MLNLLEQATTPVMSTSFGAAIIVSGSTLFAAAAAIYKAGQLTGKFDEFKGNVESKIREHQQMVDGVVYEKELQAMTKHIDYRFEEVGRQLSDMHQEIRRLRDQ